jgi:ABC-type transporter MlaC component
LPLRVHTGHAVPTIAHTAFTPIVVPPACTIHALGKNYGTISKIVKSFKNEFTNHIRKQFNNFEFFIVSITLFSL